jgi:hypothetical protein
MNHGAMHPKLGQHTHRRIPDGGYSYIAEGLAWNKYGGTLGIHISSRSLKSQTKDSAISVGWDGK